MNQQIFKPTLITVIDVTNNSIFSSILWNINFLFIFQVTNADLSFQNIMKCYRTQPQAVSHVSFF